MDKKKTLLNQEEASEYLNRSAATLWRMRKRGTLAFIKYGNKILYKLSDLNEFLEDNYISKRSN